MIYRIDVRGRSPRDAAMGGLARSGAGGGDPLGESVRQQILEFGSDVGAISTRRVYLIDTEASEEQIRRVADELLADPIVEEAQVLGPGDANTQAADDRDSRI